MQLEGKKIILGVTGSIAAYKSAFLTRLLIKAGADVKVIMTDVAAHFVSAVTFSTLSKNPVYTDFYKKDGSGEWNSHVELGLWADLMLIVPATANTIAKMANGICDNVLLATYLSARCPVYFAPAMDLDMYIHPSVNTNIQKLIEYGNTIIHPNEGELASGLFGEGRMAEPEEIVQFIYRNLEGSTELSGKYFLVTAGPTYEAIDPVRFIGNRSSGKMGFEIAEEIAINGGEVILITGPTQLKAKHPNIRTIKVENAADMYKHSLEHFSEMDAAIMSAAVADYRPIEPKSSKIKKKDNNLNLKLEATQDILASLGKIKEHQLLIGFALETNNELENAKAKLIHKNADLIVLNSLNDAGAGFNHDTNKVWLIDEKSEVELDLMSKTEVAKKIVERLKEII